MNRRTFIEFAALLPMALVCVLKASVCLAEPQQRGAQETQALAAVQKEFDEAQAQLEEIGARLEQTQLAIRKTSVALGDLGREIAATQHGIDNATYELELAQNALAAFLVISYKSGNLSTLDLLMSSVDFNDYVTRSHYVGALQDSQVKTIDEIKNLKIYLEQQRTVLSEQESEQSGLLVTLKAQEDYLSEQKKAADNVVKGLSAEVQALFDQQQAVLQEAAAARAVARAASESAAAVGLYTPSESQGSVVENAYACLGIPYVWGGADDNYAAYGGYDCSGLVQHCYALEGYLIGRTTWDQIDQIAALGNWRNDMADLNPGDLVFPNDGHVGIYLGDGMMIDAPFPGSYVKIDVLTVIIGGGSPV